MSGQIFESGDVFTLVCFLGWATGSRRCETIFRIFCSGSLHVFIGNISTYTELAHQKESIREFSLILGTKIGY